MLFIVHGLVWIGLADMILNLQSDIPCHHCCVKLNPQYIRWIIDDRCHKRVGVLTIVGLYVYV